MILFDKLRSMFTARNPARNISRDSRTGIDWAAIAAAAAPHEKYIPYFIQQSGLSLNDMRIITFEYSTQAWAEFFYENVALLATAKGKRVEVVNAIAKSICALSMYAAIHGVD